MHSIRVLFSYVLSNQRKKHHNVQSETRKLSQGADENSEKKTRKLTREKTSMIERKKKKKQFLAPHLTIFNRPCYSLHIF